MTAAGPAVMWTIAELYSRKLMADPSAPTSAAATQNRSGTSIGSGSAPLVQREMASGNTTTVATANWWAVTTSGFSPAFKPLATIVYSAADRAPPTISRSPTPGVPKPAAPSSTRSPTTAISTAAIIDRPAGSCRNTAASTTTNPHSSPVTSDAFAAVVSRSPKLNSRYANPGSSNPSDTTRAHDCGRR